MKRCPICAEMVDDHLSACPYCGEPFSSASSSAAPQPTTPKQEQPAPNNPSPNTGEMRFCPVCGERIGAHLSVCPVCFEPTGFGANSSQEAATPKNAAKEAPVSEQPSQPEPASKPERKLVFDQEPEPQRETRAEPEPETRNRQETRYQQEPETRYRQEQETRYQQEPEPSRQWPPEDPYSTSAPPKGANPLKWLLIALIALLAIGLGVLGYFLLRGDKDGEEPPTDPKEIVDPDATNQLTGKELFEHRIDSVQQNIPEEAYAVNAYPNAEHPCIYYVLNDKLMVYQAESDKTESVTIPNTTDKETVLDAMIDSLDSDYLLIDMGDKDGDYTYSYKMNTLTGSFEKIEEEEPEEEEPVQVQTVQKPKTTTKKAVVEEEEYYEDDYYDAPQRHRMNRFDRDRPRRQFRSAEEREEFQRRRMERMERMERMRREGRRPGDYPPRRGGNGFHLEPVNPGQNPSSSSGNGFHLEPVN